MRKIVTLISAGVFLFFSGALAQVSAPTNFPSPIDEPELAAVEPISAIEATRPIVYLQDFSLSGSEFKPGGSIGIRFTAVSGNEVALSDVQYSVALLKNVLLFDEKIFEEKLLIYPEDKIRKSIQYKLPEKLADGEYLIGVYLVNAKGMTYGFADPLPIKISGGGAFVELSNPQIIVRGATYPAAAGVTVKSNDTIRGEAAFHNLSNETILVMPRVKILKRGLSDQILQSYDEPAFSLDGDDSDILSFDFRYKYSDPEALVADIVLLDKEGNTISNHALFRWVTEGIGGEVVAIQALPPDPTFKTYKAVVYYYGPADAQTKAGSAELVVTLIDQGKVIGQTTESINLNRLDSRTVTVIANAYAESPEIKAEIVKSGKVLDNYSITQPPIKAVFPATAALWIVVASLAAGLIVFLVKKIGMRKSQVILPLLFVAGFLFLNVDIAKASIVEVRNDYGFGYSLQDPTHNQTVIAGDTIRFSGQIYQEGCGNVTNTSDKDKIKFYIDNTELSGYLSLTEVFCGAGKYCLSFNYSFSVPADLAAGPHKAGFFFAGYHPWICEADPNNPVCQRPLEEQGYYYLDVYEHILVSNPGTEQPTNLSSFCPVPGTRATIAWFPVSGAKFYALRINNLADDWTGTCSSAAGDFCQDIQAPATSFSFISRLNNAYQWWVHACNDISCGNAALGQNFICRDRLPQCSDSLDNDGDGLPDFPNDPSCFSATDNNENVSFIIEFNSSPASIGIGGVSNLIWSTVGLNSCSINQGIGSVLVNGSRPVSPAQTTTYTLNCLQGPNSNNPISRQATVQVRSSSLEEVIP
ncbi:MAG: hypothetical protein A3I24_04485 [Candidatus Harrisonbacteria bacterium RIFCSPLOWO2_02_FULL_41_13b]|uniref:CARDB domain-containing protein n=1 Tax=Candidatus Harrisonbacteria bacterium RIFCSPLOWO2_02_FULL_41_13b TaxID=1798409 RepID=A0A1G1ZQL7_9BACT|nr:MAG: hypothetical protein A3I24_04485 [Candidatus Harrisonbacteria bacterium RIFCSPLOWO2_02_FULL_41_13b]